jgi:tetratricopeptide (TPR) repeat protein
VLSRWLKLKSPQPMSDLEPPRPSLLRRLLLSLLILTVLCGAAYASYWAYGKLKGRQSRHLTKMATDYLQKNKVAEAEMSLDTAIRLKPNNAEALRMLARLQGATGKGADSLETWQKLAASGGITLDDLAQYSMAASREGDQALAERLADAAATGGNTVLRHMMRANLLLSKNDIPGAEAEFRQAAESDTTGNSSAMLARFLLTQRLNAETAPEIREMLRELSKRPDVIGLEALSTAITRCLVPPAELPVWIAALRVHPKATTQALLLADATDIQLQPGTKPVVLAKMLERMKGAPVDDRAAGMQFLILMKEPAKAAGLLTRDEALNKRETLAMWLDAQSLTQNWPAILDILAQPNLPLPDHLAKLYHGRALAMSGKEAEGRAAYSKALQDTAGTKAEFLETLAYLNLAGEDQLFDQGLQSALSDPATAKESFIRILPSVAMRQDAARTRRAYEIAAATSPELAKDLTLQNDLAYLSLLLGLPVDTKKIAFLSEANPRDFSFRITYALALLKAGKNKEALALLENCEPDVHVDTLAPHQKAIVAIAMAANDRRNEALGVAAILPPQQLSKQEIELMQSYLEQPKSSPTPKPATSKKEAPKKK